MLMALAPNLFLGIRLSGEMNELVEDTMGRKVLIEVLGKLKHLA